jgi:hypothetical protein
MTNAILYRMDSGIPGTLNRMEHCTVEPQLYDQTLPPTVFGIPIKYVTGKVLPIAAADTVANVVQGFLVRSYPTQGTTSEALGAGTPNKAQIANVMKRGYMTVKVNASLPSAVPAKGGAVYCRKTDHGAGEYLVGGVESDADSAKCEAITGCYFTGPMDANGNVEIAFNI